jgi:hypothetical protein
MEGVMSDHGPYSDWFSKTDLCTAIGLSQNTKLSANDPAIAMIAAGKRNQADQESTDEFSGRGLSAAPYRRGAVSLELPSLPCTHGMEAAMSNATWKDLYDAAVVEFDLKKLPERVEAALL